MTQTEFTFDKGPSAGTLNAWGLEALQHYRPSDQAWWVPAELIKFIRVGHSVLISDSSCTARLRDLRKPRYGAHVIEKRKREGSRAYEYRLKAS